MTLASQWGREWSFKNGSHKVKVWECDTEKRLVVLTCGTALGESCRNTTKLDIFPGDILLEVFDFCRLGARAGETQDDENFLNWWHELVHVCQRWRQLIFTSLHRLNVQLLCTCETPSRNKLGCWPSIPITLNVKGLRNLNPTEEDNLSTAFEHADRVCSVTLNVTQRQLRKVVKMMLKPFPVLKHLRVKTFNGSMLSFPSGFPPGLRELDLSGTFPPPLPSILSLLSDLVHLHLHDLPMIGHVSPEAMVTGLAVMTKLESLTIEFEFISHGRCPLPAQDFGAQAVLPTLTQFQFRGVHEYLKDLVAKLDTPRLFDLTVIIVNMCTWPHYSVVQQFPQLFQFIGRAEDLKLAQFRHARAEIHDSCSFIRFDNAQTGQHPIQLTLGEVKLGSSPLYYNQLQPIEALLSQASAIISSVQHLSITQLHQRTKCATYWDCAKWLRFLQVHLFDDVETLHIGRQFTDHFVHVLNGLSNELVAEVLPALHLLNFEGKPQKMVKQLLIQFIEKRRSIGRPPLTVVKSRKVFERLRALGETDVVTHKNCIPHGL